MVMTMRVSLPGYDCLTDGTIDHYSIYADTDNILIKEYTRGTIPLSNGQNGTITHSLGYVPLTFMWVNVGGTMQFLAGNDAGQSFNATFGLGTQNLIITDSQAGTNTFNYFIFYDQGTML